jgi:hypothetical protein
VAAASTSAELSYSMFVAIAITKKYEENYLFVTTSSVLLFLSSEQHTSKLIHNTENS